jgi:hypothetical protein
MLLKNKQNGTLVEVQDTTTLIDPFEDNINGRTQAGQEEQPTEEFAKNNLLFPSGENLPRCWIDADYKSSL